MSTPSSPAPDGRAPALRSGRLPPPGTPGPPAPLPQPPVSPPSRLLRIGGTVSALVAGALGLLATLSGLTSWGLHYATPSGSCVHRPRGCVPLVTDHVFRSPGMLALAIATGAVEVVLAVLVVRALRLRRQPATARRRWRLVLLAAVAVLALALVTLGEATRIRSLTF